MRSRSVKFLAVAALVALPSVVQAQLSCSVASGGNCAVNATASLTIPSIATVTIPSNAIALNGAGLTNFSVIQYAPGAFGNVTVVANTPYTLNIGSAAANWTTTVGTGVRARNTLEYSIDGGTNFLALGAGTALPGGAATSGLSTPVQFRAVLPADASDAANRPGTYTLLVAFTLTAP